MDPDLQCPAVFCDDLQFLQNLRFSAVSCALQVPDFPGERVKISENQRKSAFWAQSVNPRSVPLSTPWPQAWALPLLPRCYWPHIVPLADSLQGGMMARLLPYRTAKAPAMGKHLTKIPGEFWTYETALGEFSNILGFASTRVFRVFLITMFGTPTPTIGDKIVTYYVLKKMKTV